MSRSYNVRTWKIQRRKNAQGKTTSYRVRWGVDGRPFTRSFQRSAQAESFRSHLVSAANNGEAFAVTSGLPVSMERDQARVTWFDFACSYMDMKWPDASPKYRKSLAQDLVPTTIAMLRSDSTLPDGHLLRKSLHRAFNRNTRDSEHEPDVQEALVRIQRASRDVGSLADPDVLRKVLRAIDLKLDGDRASTNTVRLRRVALNNAIEYAIERRLLSENPLNSVKTKRRKSVVKQVDPNAVVNPAQARALIEAVRTLGKPGPPLVAFFGLMYYSALRPEEAASLKKENLSLPEHGWGDLHLSAARPEISPEWTDSGNAGEERSLKHREDDEGRTVPCPPALTELLHEHLDKFGTAPDGRLFRGARNGGRVGSTTYGRVWANAREAALTPEQAASPLAKRPYDLRHAAVSTWLNGGVEATRVAKWAGHSLAVLLRVYAKCLDGGEEAARKRISETLDTW